ncbi:MAG TPA: hypothetical protein VLA44_02175 [Clostridia bacterium]|nr:hypothetical protein [Clostridia bacterium]
MNEPPAERTIEGGWYRLTVRDGAPVAWLDDRDGRHWTQLRLLGSADTLDGTDETFGLDGPLEEALPGGGTRLTWRLRGSRWAAKRLVVEAGTANLAIHLELEGTGRLGAFRLLGGRVVAPTGSGLLMSGAWFDALFSPGPSDPLRVVGSARESAVIGAASGAEGGRGAWFFTPGPLVFAANRARPPSPIEIPPGPWLTFGLGVGLEDTNFAEFRYRAIDRGFCFELDYDGKTEVVGRWRSPSIVIGHSADPYAAIGAHGRWLELRGLVPPTLSAPPTPAAAWWRQPVFCGWGAQSRLAFQAGLGLRGAAGMATQANYDAFLGHLERHGIVPGTIVIDDKWQATYGACLPDEAKWPDLRGWIARRRSRGQRVLLWWKAWDAEGLPAEWCVRSERGAPLGLDPTHPAARETLRATVRTMLAADGLDADGLKIDFTARTPSGTATRHHGGPWGIALLHELLAVVAAEAKRVKPDALLVGQTPNPMFGSVVDMVRLNDALRLDDPEPRIDIVPQMRYRAAVARAALPGHLVDTDDWCAPDLATWRRFLEAKLDLGVPALYYATGLDLSGEAFEEDDYAAIRRVWATYRAREGLPEPAADGGRSAPAGG